MIQLALRFWTWVLAWTLAIAAVLSLISLLSGTGAGELAAELPAWVGLAAAIATFPAGVMVAQLVFAERMLLRLATVAAAAVVVCAAMFVLGNYVGPRLTRAALPATQLSSSSLEPSMMTLGELSAEAQAAIEQASSATGVDAVRRWQLANRLVWHLIRRTDGTALPLLFGLLGVLTGFWSRWTSRSEVQMAQQWAMGLFLLVSTYLAGENSYELIVMRSAGPVFFAGDLALVVPTLLVIGLGWPTVLTALRQRRGEWFWPD